MTKVISKDFPDERKCGCCNWNTTTFYCLDGEDFETSGLCASCFLEMVMQERWEIHNK